MSKTDLVLPHNIEAEQSFLGTLLNNITILPSLSVTPSPKDFFLDRHSIIASAIYSDTQVEIDIVSITEILKSQGNLEKIGGPVYLAELTNQGFHSANIEYYANLIVEKSQRRSIIKNMHTLVADAQNESIGIQSILEKTEKNIFEITDRDSHADYYSFENIVTQFGKNLDTMISSDRIKGSYAGIPTKYPVLDQMLAGLHGGDLIILAARPSMGKTALALNFINNIAIEEHIPTAFFSLEMSALDITTRIVCMRTKVDSSKIRQNMLDPTDISKISIGISVSMKAPLFISDASVLNLFDLRVQARRLVKTHGVKVIFVDYLGLVSSDGHHNSIYERVTEVSRALKAIARELKIPFVVLAQLNRDSEDREPSLAHLRDSGAIEQDADVVLLLHRPKRDSHDAKVIIAKQRNGPTGEAYFRFDHKYSLFSEQAEGYDAKAAFSYNKPDKKEYKSKSRS